LVQGEKAQQDSYIRYTAV